MTFYILAHFDDSSDLSRRTILLLQVTMLGQVMNRPHYLFQVRLSLYHQCNYVFLFFFFFSLIMTRPFLLMQQMIIIKKKNSHKKLPEMLCQTQLLLLLLLYLFEELHYQSGSTKYESCHFTANNLHTINNAINPKVPHQPPTPPRTTPRRRDLFARVSQGLRGDSNQLLNLHIWVLQLCGHLRTSCWISIPQLSPTCPGDQRDAQVQPGYISSVARFRTTAVCNHKQNTAGQRGSAVSIYSNQLILEFQFGRGFLEPDCYSLKSGVNGLCSAHLCFSHRDAYQDL